MEASPEHLRSRVVTVLTLLVSLIWLTVLFMRLVLHASVDSAPVLDAGMLLILGYWFSSSANKGG